jgi:uncharacterized membrane-anchored protein YjiN (DUF445 family)
MPRDFFKTTARQRESSDTTRKVREKARKPEPREVDEALSAAVKKSLRTNLRDVALKQAKNLVPEKVFRNDVHNDILAMVIDHLVEVRGMDPVKSKEALQERLKKKRRYHN